MFLREQKFPHVVAGWGERGHIQCKLSKGGRSSISADDQSLKRLVPWLLLSRNLGDQRTLKPNHKRPIPIDPCSLACCWKWTKQTNWLNDRPASFWFGKNKFIDQLLLLRWQNALSCILLLARSFTFWLLCVYLCCCCFDIKAGRLDRRETDREFS